MGFRARETFLEMQRTVQQEEQEERLQALFQAAEEEMERETKIDKAIDNEVKRFLKRNENKKYRMASTKKEADAMLIFPRHNLSGYSFALKGKKNNDEIDNWARDNLITIIYLKNKNPHDSRSATIGETNKLRPPKKLYE